MKIWSGQSFQLGFWKVTIQTVVISWLLLALGAGAFNLIRPEGLSLTKDIYEDDGASCDKSTALRATFDSFWLPKSPQEFTLTLSLERLEGVSSNGILLNLQGAVLRIEAQRGLLILDLSNGDNLEYVLPLGGSGKINLGLSRRSDGAFKICTNNKLAEITTLGNAAVRIDQAGWATISGGDSLNIPQDSLIFGDSTNNGESMTGILKSSLFMSQTMECEEINTKSATYLENLKANTAPETKNVWQSPAIVVVEDFVTVSASGVDVDGDNLRMKLTFFGVSEENCDKANCGDLTTESFGTEGSATIHGVVKYQRAGRYVVRVQVTDMLGHTATEDLSILVRKVGDTEGKAKCCRHTGMVIALQQGRPIHNTNFRDSSIYSNAKDSKFRWSEEYLNTEDIEAERLFDFGMLAPALSGPLSLVTCHDTRVAGAGSSKVLTYTHEKRMLGHNKRMLVLTEGLPWGGWSNVTIERPECVADFTNWAETSPYKGESKGRTCSYTCTADGVSSLIQNTGSYDRMAESLMEVSYGRASLDWNVTIAEDIIELPVDTKTNLFSYHDLPARKYVKDVLSIEDLGEKYFETMVLSPWPHHNNPGQLAWASGTDAFPAIFVLRCNPQLYYLVHETGHRFGLPHSVVYKVEDGTEAPTDPLSPGVIEDSYSDKLDIMACCKGSYNLYSRIYAGWVQGHERQHLSLPSLAEKKTHRFTLWPFDRAESRGQQMAVTMRLANDKALVFGFRSVPYYQDVKIGRWPNDRKEGVLASEDMRTNILGLSVGYSNRYIKRGKEVWSIRGLLDFNLLYGEWPDALPVNKNRFPPQPAYDAYAQLKEGYPWFHMEEGQSSGFMVMVERLRDCPAPSELVEYQYSAKGFYGWRGEFPFQEMAEKHDYTGYEDLKCMDLVIKTGVTEEAPSERLDMKVHFADERAGGIFLHESCGFSLNPRVKVTVPDDVQLSAVIWKDNLNKTISTDEIVIQLPGLTALRESSNLGAPECKISCPQSYTVKAATEDGRHARAEMRIEASFEQYTMYIKYTYYDKNGFHHFEDSQKVEVVKKLVETATAPRGINMYGNKNWPALNTKPLKVEAEAFPNVECSHQWTMTTLLNVEQIEGTATIFSIGQIPHSEDSSMPLVQISKSDENEYQLIIHWQSNQAVLDISQQLNPTLGLKQIHIMIVRDGDELGAWVNGQGFWFPGTVWCIPSRQDLLFCDHQATGSGFSWGKDTGMWIGDHTEGFQGGLRFLRLYNYAIPQSSWENEKNCPEDLHIEFFMIQKEDAAINKNAQIPTITQRIAQGPAELHRYVWNTGSWGPCSSHCGGGYRRRAITCIDKNEEAKGTIPSEFCLDVHRPAHKEQCNLRACTPHKLILGGIVEEGKDACGDLPECGIRDTGSLLCQSDSGFLVPAWECNIRTLRDFKAASSKLISSRSQKCKDQATICASGASQFSWKMSTWSTCTRKCGGGTQTREVVCTAGDTPVDNEQCNGLPKGSLVDYKLSRTCNSHPCQIFTWKVGEWDLCHGEETGYSFRTVDCIDKNNKVVADALCLSEKPPDEELCLVNEASARCQPVNSPSDEPDCSGNGECTFLGCHCMNGHHGTYCHTPPDCLGILGRSNTCCETGVVDKRGNCCSGGDAILDKDGRCCDSGNIDACGECDGKGKAVDILGLCCTSNLLDNSGVCCHSGLVDECGVCDGDGTSCALSFTLSFLAVEPNSISESTPSGTFTAPNLSPQEWETFKQALVQAISSAIGIRASRIIAGSIHLLDKSADPAQPDSVRVENRIHSRRLTQSSAQSPTGELAIDVLILHSDELPILAHDIFTKLEPIVKSKSPFQAKNPEPIQVGYVPVLLDIRDVSRNGICGNGVCEVGEQEAYPLGTAGKSTCPEDCQASLQLCPTPSVGGIGVRKEPCGLNGVCHIASGTCDCYTGYSGNACDACSPGYSKSSGLCQSLYINGTSVNSRLPAFARASHLDKLEGNGKSANSSSIIWIAVGCIGAFTICGACILLLLVRKRRRNQSYMVHRDRRSSRKTQQGSRYGQGIQQVVPAQSSGAIGKISAKSSYPTTDASSGNGSPQIRVVSIPKRKNELAKDATVTGPNSDFQSNVSPDTRSRLERLSSVLEAGQNQIQRQPSLAEEKLGPVTRVDLKPSGSNDENLRHGIDVLTSMGKGWIVQTASQDEHL